MRRETMATITATSRKTQQEWAHSGRIAVSRDGENEKLKANAAGKPLWCRVRLYWAALSNAGWVTAAVTQRPNISGKHEGGTSHKDVHSCNRGNWYRAQDKQSPCCSKSQTTKYELGKGLVWIVQDGCCEVFNERKWELNSALYDSL